MKKSSTVICFFCLTILLFSLQGLAEKKPTLDHGFQLHASETACPSGRPILNVNRKIINSLDSGTGLNDSGAGWWAYIDYIQNIQAVEIAPGEYCATAKVQGSFESVGGDGPGCDTEGTCGTQEGYLEAGDIGTFQGGAIFTITGAFNPDNLRTKGNIGTFDHGCDATDPSGGCNGQGSRKFIYEYFSPPTFNYDWWGFVYHAGNNGGWVNASSGNEGNITGD